MKKKSILRISIVIIVILVSAIIIVDKITNGPITSYLIGLMWDNVFKAQNKVLTEVKSPDNKYIATLFEKDWGAAASTKTAVGLRKKNTKFNPEDYKSMVFILAYGKNVKLEWKDANTLYISSGTFDANDLISAEQKWENVNIVYENKPQIYNRFGIDYSKEGEYAKAIENFNKSIDLDKNNGGYVCNRGLAYFKKGDLDKAIKDFDKTIEMDPKYLAAYMNRGSIYFKKGNYNASIKDLNKVIELDPTLADAYEYRGQTYEKFGQKDKADADFRKAKELGYKK